VSLHGDSCRKGLEGSKIATGIQNISKTDNGAYTGEITAGMAKDVGFTWTLIGHSERRSLYAETIEETCEKLKKAQAAGLAVISAVASLSKSVRQVKLMKSIKHSWIRHWSSLTSRTLTSL